MLCLHWLWQQWHCRSKKRWWNIIEATSSPGRGDDSSNQDGPKWPRHSNLDRQLQTRAYLSTNLPWYSAVTWCALPLSSLPLLTMWLSPQLYQSSSRLGEVADYVKVKDIYQTYRHTLNIVNCLKISLLLELHLGLTNGKICIYTFRNMEFYIFITFVFNNYSVIINSHPLIVCNDLFNYL